MNMHERMGACFTSTKDDWETPQYLFDKLNEKFHFTLDPCSSHENTKCLRHYTVEDDGLSKSWKGEVVFCNPPYGRQISKWVEKCAKEDCVSVLLVPARTDTKWFHDYIYNKPNVRIEFLRGRLKFEVNGTPMNSAPFPSMLVYFNDR